MFEGWFGVVGLGLMDLPQLAPPQDQRLDLPREGVGDGSLTRAHGLGEGRQNGSVDAVGLGEAAGGAGEVAHLTRIDHGDGQGGQVQFSDQRGLVAAGGLQRECSAENVVAMFKAAHDYRW